MKEIGGGRVSVVRKGGIRGTGRGMVVVGKSQAADLTRVDVRCFLLQLYKFVSAFCILYCIVFQHSS